MFNILKSTKEIPKKFKIFFIERKNLEIRIKKLRSEYSKLGWNVLTLGNKLGFISIDKKNENLDPPLLKNCLKDNSSFKEDLYIWNENLENQNQFSHLLFSSLIYNIFKPQNQNDFSLANKIGLRFKRDILKNEPVYSTRNYKVYEGVQFIPSLIKKKEKLFISFICRRIIRVKGRVRGSPREIQSISQLRSDSYFNKLGDLLNQLIGNDIICTFGDFSIQLRNKLISLNLRKIRNLEKPLELPDEIIKEYKEETVYDEELEEEIYNEYSEHDVKLLENELMEYILPVIPLKIYFGILNEPPLWVGRDVKESRKTTHYLLNQFGPYSTPDRKVIFIPLYPKNQSNIKDKIRKISEFIISGSGSGKYDFPGLINGFNLQVNLTSPKNFPLNLSKQDFERRILEILEEVEREFPNLPKIFKLDKAFTPFFLIGFKESNKAGWGEFTPIYQYFKENLVGLGFPSQMITNFNAFFGNYKSFPLWSVSSAIFSKIGGIPWVVEANYTKNNIPIDYIIGFRFARQKSKNQNNYILGVATIFSGNGKYLGFKTKSIPIDDVDENYKFIFKSHGYTRRYEGLKIPAKQVKSLFYDATRLVDKSEFHQKKSGAVVVHRLGSVSSEEADAFLNSFKTSIFTAGSLVSMSEHPLRWKLKDKTVNRGTWINLDKRSGILFPQGLTSYYQGSYYKPYSPKSIPRAFKISIIRDHEVYEYPHDAGYDIMSLSRMNWRHTTFIPSNYPISLQYALIIANYYKNNIIPSGDLVETPWFL